MLWLSAGRVWDITPGSGAVSPPPPPNPREDPSLPHWPEVPVDQVPGSGFQRRKEGDCF